jgi:hypothetical protein
MNVSGNFPVLDVTFDCSKVNVSANVALTVRVSADVVIFFPLQIEISMF